MKRPPNISGVQDALTSKTMRVVQPYQHRLAILVVWICEVLPTFQKVRSQKDSRSVFILKGAIWDRGATPLLARHYGAIARINGYIYVKLDPIPCPTLWRVCICCRTSMSVA